jgi:hypothetical protein
MVRNGRPALEVRPPGRRLVSARASGYSSATIVLDIGEHQARKGSRAPWSRHPVGDANFRIEAWAEV